jgi:hypothetical protein
VFVRGVFSEVGWLDGWMTEWLDGCIAGWLDGWMAVLLDGWMARMLNQVKPPPVGPIER